MELSQAALACLYWYAFLFGAGAGLLYDLLGASRVFFGFRSASGVTERLQNVKWRFLSPHRIPKGRGWGRAALLFVQDFLFCLFAAGGMILLLYEQNHGKLRVLVLLSAAAGFAAFRMTVGRLLSFVLEAAIFFVILTVRYAVFFVTRPFLWIGKSIVSAVKALCRRKALRRQRKQRKQLTERLFSGEQEIGRLLAAMERFPEWSASADALRKEPKQREVHHEKNGKETVQYGTYVPDSHRRGRSHRGGRFSAGHHAL